MVKHLSTAVLTGIIALVFAVTPVSAQTSVTDQTQKLDKKLLETLSKAPEPMRVIIRTKGGQTTLLRNALQAHGDVVETQHNEIEALTAVVHGEDILAIANDPSVESVSIDAVVRSMGSKYTSARKQVREAKAAKAAAKGKAKVAKAKTKARAKAKAATKAAKVRIKRSRTKAAKVETEPEEIIGNRRKILGLGRGFGNGKGIGVAVIDSGIDGDFADFNITAFVDFTQGGQPVWTDPYDDFGHGTHIAGIIAGRNQERTDKKFQGVATGVRLIGLKVLDGNGAGRSSDVIAAIEYAIENRAWMGIDVINLSLGHPIYESAASDPLVLAVEEAHRAGIVVVCSAGNFGMSPSTREVGYGGLTSPGNAPSAITVGAVDTKNTNKRTDDYIAPFSSRGPTWIDGFAKPDLVAPGVGEISKRSKDGGLFSTYPQLLFDEDAGHESEESKRFARMSGTSMAAAEVTGVVAVVLEANPNLTANLVKAILEYTATPLFNKDGLLYDMLTQGAGEVNAGGAVTLARAIDTAPEYTDAWPIGEFTPSTTFGPDDLAWSQNIVWGNYVVEAQAYELFTRSEAWDDNIVWGTMGRSDDDNIVWGNFARDEDDNIVWGNFAVWGSLYDDEQADNIVWGNFSRGDDVDDNIVWGNFFRGDDDNIVWGNSFIWDDNIVWGASFLGTRDEGDDDNIVWGNLFKWDGDDDNIVWGNLDDENIVWGNYYRGDDGENIVWGNSIVIGF